MKLLVRSATSIESATSSDVRSKIISDLGQDGTNDVKVTKISDTFYTI